VGSVGTHTIKCLSGFYDEPIVDRAGDFSPGWATIPVIPNKPSGGDGGTRCFVLGEVEEINYLLILRPR
jgi:hypothetical protein